jgi:opacity protein-like surface antigen
MNKPFFLAPLFCLAATNVTAGTMGEAPSVHNNVITLSGGPSWSLSGKSQVIYLEPDVFNAYKANKKDSTLGSAELFFGMQRLLGQSFIGQLGIAFAGSSNAKLSGSVWYDADPAFDNFFYNYKINHTHVALKAKVLAGTQFFVQPYVSGSVGVGFNRANDFRMTPKIFEQLTPPSFNSHTETSFTYTAGAGLQKSFCEYWSLGVGYEFADWGKSKLSRSIAQSIGAGPKLNHLYTHQLQFSLSYHV